MTRVQRLVRRLDAHERQGVRLAEAMYAAFPVGAYVRWRHGNHWRGGTVVRHGKAWQDAGGDLFVRTDSGKEVRIGLERVLRDQA